VETLVERIESGGFDDLAGVVCPEREDEIRTAFDPSASDATFGGVQVAITDPVATVVSEDGPTAVVKLTGSMRISFDQEQARAFVRAQLEASGQGASDGDIDDLLALMFPAGDLPLDEDLTVVERDGEWLICGTGDGGGSFTDAGMCGLVTPDEVAALSPMPIDSNVGEGDFCQWIGASAADYFSIDVGLVRGASLDEYRDADPTSRDLTVGGLPALASSGQVYVAVDTGVLSVLPYVADSPDPGLDPIALAASVAELFVPRLGQLPEIDPDDLAPGPDGGAPLFDCAVIDIEALNALSPLRYDSVSGGAGACTFASNDPAAGSPFLSVTLDPATAIEDLAVIFPDGTDGDVDGRPSFGAVDTLWVQLDDGLLAISPVYAGSPEAADLDPYAYAADVARVVIAALDASS
jgi:hypothetical protein